MRITLKQQLDAFKEGKIIDSDGLESKCFNFYDWFCKDSSLKNKAFQLFPKVKKFIKLKNIDPNTVYVFFKNNCPVYGSTYDDFRICDIKTGDVVFTVTPSSGFERKRGQCEVWGKENDFKEPIMTFDKWGDMFKS